jgi:hypothetical protein
MLAKNSRRSSRNASAPSATEKDLRLRIAELKSTVGAFHTEKQQLLLKLRDVRQEAASRAMSADKEKISEAPEAEDSLAPFGELGLQPVRIPVFSAEFRKALKKVPKVVGARAMSIAGSLAAGDAKAFADARYLKLAKGQLRVRVGRAYRLLFRLEEDDIEFIKLIHRRDLERILAR